MTDTTEGFVDHLQNMIRWIDTEAQQLSKEDILDTVKARMLRMAKKFIAYPHCNNFSLMPPPLASKT
jgi:hypothetical protein